MTRPINNAAKGKLIPFLLRDRLKELKGGELLVWMAYTLYSNRQDVAWPGRKKLQEGIGLHRDTISDIRGRLVCKGWLVRQPNQRMAAGRYAPPRFLVQILPPHKSTVPEKGQHGKNATVPVKHRHGHNSGAEETLANGAEETSALSTTVKYYRKEKTETQALSRPRADGFDLFWQAYPKRQAKVQAEKAWRKVKPSEVAAIMVAVKAYAASNEWRREQGRYIPFAATFLNQRRWEDELASPVGKGTGKVDPPGKYEAYGKRKAWGTGAVAEELHREAQVGKGPDVCDCGRCESCKRGAERMRAAFKDTTKPCAKVGCSGRVQYLGSAQYCAPCVASRQARRGESEELQRGSYRKETGAGGG